MVDTLLENYIKKHCKGDYKPNWINYYIVVNTNNKNGNQKIFVRFNDTILIYHNDKFIKKVNINNEK